MQNAIALYKILFDYICFNNQDYSSYRIDKRQFCLLRRLIALNRLIDSNLGNSSQLDSKVLTSRFLKLKSKLEFDSSRFLELKSKLDSKNRFELLRDKVI